MGVGGGGVVFLLCFAFIQSQCFKLFHTIVNPFQIVVVVDFKTYIYVEPN